MVLKASFNGPNRRRNRVGDHSVASNFQTSSNTGDKKTSNKEEVAKLSFRVRSLEKFLEENGDDLGMHEHTLGDACIFTHGSGNGIGSTAVIAPGGNSRSGSLLLQTHFQIVGEFPNEGAGVGKPSDNDPVLIHFHDTPVFILRAIPIIGNEDEDFIYLSQAHCFNHKICEDTVYQITCCSRPDQKLNKLSQSTKSASINNYDDISAIQIEVYRRYSDTTFESQMNEATEDHKATSEDNSKRSEIQFCATQIAKELMNHSNRSVLTVNECLVINVMETDLVCRVSKICVESSLGTNQDGSESAAAATMDDPYRGRINVNTAFYVKPSAASSSLKINGATTLPEGKLPEDVIHVTTSDMEWFPVRRILLVPCIKLTKYVQAGHGKYKTDNTILNDNVLSEYSPDAPTDDGLPHCKIDIDCCTFDRVLLFIMSILYPSTPDYKFALGLSEINSLSHAAEVLGLQPLTDLCASQASSFHSRVRKDKYIRLAEVKQRNADEELLIILDGMVLDITRWIDEHPGGPSIIPTQALNIDCTVFFELFHVSRQSFLYLKSFYIGELSPEDFELLQHSRTDGASASDGFLQSLRSYTSEWRVKVKEGNDKTVHKSL